MVGLRNPTVDASATIEYVPGGAVSITALIPTSDRHGHVIHRETVAALGLTQLIPEPGGSRGPILGIASSFRRIGLGHRRRETRRSVPARAYPCNLLDNLI